jgi:hypothetical protein
VRTLLFTLLALTFVACAGFKPAAPRDARGEAPQKSAAGPRPEELTPEELEALLRGKGGIYVLKLPGNPPFQTQRGVHELDSPEYEGRFEYQRMTLREPDRRGTAQYQVVIHFSSGVVQRVQITPAVAPR